MLETYKSNKVERSTLENRRMLKATISSNTAKPDLS